MIKFKFASSSLRLMEATFLLNDALYYILYMWKLFEYQSKIESSINQDNE